LAEQIVVADIGGTNARFALATLDGAQRPTIGEVTRLPAADYPGLPEAWRDFIAAIGRPPPSRAAIAIAAPMRGEVLSFTNSAWKIPRDAIGRALGLDEVLLLNDFGAAAHAVDALRPDELLHICGPDTALPRQGLISLIGPGTGLGVAMLAYPPSGGAPVIVETEGGHVGFAPQDAAEQAIATLVRQRHGRVSTERLVSGPGLAAIHAGLAALQGASATTLDDKALWAAATGGTDPLAAAALDRFCAIFGAVAGDLALAQGAGAVVLGGGIPPRIAERLQGGGFAARFTDKGRYHDYMAAIPVKMMIHPEPGLLGAAVALARKPAAKG
jgi:glucokinase